MCWILQDTYLLTFLWHTMKPVLTGTLNGLQLHTYMNVYKLSYCLQMGTNSILNNCPYLNYTNIIALMLTLAVVGQRVYYSVTLSST